MKSNGMDMTIRQIQNATGKAGGKKIDLYITKEYGGNLRSGICKEEVSHTAICYILENSSPWASQAVSNIKQNTVRMIQHREKRIP